MCSHHERSFAVEGFCVSEIVLFWRAFLMEAASHQLLQWCWLKKSVGEKRTTSVCFPFTLTGVRAVKCNTEGMWCVWFSVTLAVRQTHQCGWESWEGRVVQVPVLSAFSQHLNHLTFAGPNVTWMTLFAVHKLQNEAKRLYVDSLPKEKSSCPDSSSHDKSVAFNMFRLKVLFHDCISQSCHVSSSLSVNVSPPESKNWAVWEGW